MSATTDTRVAVVGAGLVGSLLACYLGRRGYTVDVYERRPDPRATAAERGRSINLALSERGLDALRRIDLVDTVMAPALPMHGRMMHGTDSTLTFQSYSASGERAINSIGRGALNETLLDAAESTPGVTLHFEARLSAFDLAGNTLTFEHGRRPRRGLAGHRAGVGRLRQHRPAEPRVAGPGERRHRHARLRLQGADHPRTGRRLRPRPGCAPHLAARAHP